MSRWLVGAIDTLDGSDQFPAMNGRRILAAVFLIPATAGGYMTWLMWRAGDDGQWMFGVFTLFFMALTVAPLLPELRKKKPEPSPNTRFVPHWFMLLAMLVVVVGIILAIIGAIRAILE